MFKKLLDAIPQRSMTHEEVKQHAKRLCIPYFRGVFMRDALPKTKRKQESGIINLDDSTGFGTHFVAYTIHNANACYFDSFGLPPPTEFIQYIGSRGDIMYNRVQVQKFNTEICGRLCLQFLYYDWKNGKCRRKQQ